MKEPNTVKKRKRKKDINWLRFPTPGCPLCEGKGTWQQIMETLCGRPLNGGKPLGFHCYCVQKQGKRPTADEMVTYLEAMAGK
jgi:hypothetical protein